MAYLVLAISLVYALLWGAGLMISMRSDGKKTVWIPVLGLLLFIGFSAGSAMAVQTAMANPPRITLDTFYSVKDGMSPEDLNGLFGTPAAEDEEYDFNAYSIVYPDGVRSRLRSMTDRRAEQVDATLSMKFTGEPSRANLRRGEGLGSPADEERNGLMGVEIVLRENGNETRILEGEDWEYTDDMTAEEVAKTIGDLIDATDAWHAEGSPDSSPRSVLITPEIEENGGTVCNENCAAQITQITKAVSIRGFTDATEQGFRGGEDETHVRIWDEVGILMDADFSTANRMIIAGFVNDELVGVHQSGLEVPPEEPAEAPAE